MEVLDDRSLPVEELAEEEKLIEEMLEIEDEGGQVVEAKAHGEGLVLELEIASKSE